MTKLVAKLKPKLDIREYSPQSYQFLKPLASARETDKRFFSQKDIDHHPEQTPYYMFL